MSDQNPHQGLYYADYLQLDKLLDTQQPESKAAGDEAHDELLFILVHQAYELWFKQIIHELNYIHGVFSKAEIDDNAPDMHLVEHRLNRVVEIWKLAIDQIGVLETMTPLDFLDFRNYLTGASGFQSYQFRMIEAMLGLKMGNRHQHTYYKNAFKSHPHHLKAIEEIEQKGQPLIQLIDRWLERMPYVRKDTEDQYWQGFDTTAERVDEEHIFFADYRERYKQSLLRSDFEKKNLDDRLARFDWVFFGNEYDNLTDEEKEERAGALGPGAMRTALFIVTQQHLPMLQIPFRILNLLEELDEHMSRWRHRHLLMVRRMIGNRVGTGGTSGQKYLQGAMNKHQIFAQLEELSSFLIERSELVSELPPDLKRAMAFSK